MGLWVQSLANIPTNHHRDYFIYLLDYGWKEPLGEALMENYEKMVAIAAENKAVVIRGTRRVHFEDEVLSWHNINGEDAEEILPAILITYSCYAVFACALIFASSSKAALSALR